MITSSAVKTASTKMQKFTLPTAKLTAIYGAISNGSGIKLRRILRLL
jgi:hypothetical protein